MCASTLCLPNIEDTSSWNSSGHLSHHLAGCGHWSTAPRNYQRKPSVWCFTCIAAGSSDRLRQDLAPGDVLHQQRSAAVRLAATLAKRSGIVVATLPPVNPISAAGQLQLTANISLWYLLAARMPEAQYRVSRTRPRTQLLLIRDCS